MSGARANGNRFLVASIHDITQRKEAEKALRRSEENYRILFDATTDALFVHEIKEGGIMGNFIKVNSVACQRLGYSEEELLEMSPADIDDPEFEIDLEGIWKKISRGESVRFEQIHVTKNGERIPVEIHAQGFDWDERMAIISLVRDITERKERVEKLHSLVRQKELLLQEIHHRVKNNLNVISSLLDFESDSTQDKKTLETLRDAKNRIRAMALIHEHLYQSENLAHINFHRYAQILLEEIFYAYGISYNDVTTEINVNNISLPIDKAIPCSLIINEAVSNSLKYAFSEESTGKISIQFYEEDDNICLEIADNGIGLSHDFDLETVKTLGLRIIKMLTRQLEGSVTIDGSDGTTIKINFRKESRY
jgi:PAS domain S-box-containing protein